MINQPSPTQPLSDASTILEMYCISLEYLVCTYITGVFQMVGGYLYVVHMYIRGTLKFLILAWIQPFNLIYLL